MENVRKLAGEGVEGLHDCPPLYHFDVSNEEFEELRKDPAAFLANMDQEVLMNNGFDPDSPPSVTLGPAFSQTRGWESAEPTPQMRPGDVCCYWSGPNEVTCHDHR
jgi:hypothetical protein